MKPGMGVLKALGLTTLLVCGTQTAFAQDYPARNITVVVPFPAGGPSDVVARIVAEAMGRTLGHTLVIENVAGAGGTIGSARVATASPDGYTLLAGSMGSHVAAPVLTPNIKYDPAKDFVAIGPTAHSPAVVVARKDFPARDFKEFAADLKENGARFKQAHGGIGASSHMACVLFNTAIGASPTSVAYRGTGPAMNDLLGGQVDLLCDQTTNTSAQIEGKTIKAYAVTTMKRLTTPALKDLPTLNESGVKDFNVSIWHGMYAPKGTPADAVTKLNAALKTALKDPEFIKKQEALGAVVVSDKRTDGAEHKKFVAAEIAKWGPVIKAAGEYAD